MISEMCKKLFYYFLKQKNPLKYAQVIGVNIGNNCKLIGSPNWGSEPWLIFIGNHTEVSFDVAFITHDGATWCFRDSEQYKNVLKFGRIRIGNNCFVGARSTILPGVNIGDDCIIAAGAVVNKDIPSGEVWGGVPAQYIMKTNEYADKCKAMTPLYDVENYKNNFIVEVNKICDAIENIKNNNMDT